MSFVKKIFIPENNKVKGNKYEIKPIDWKNRSETKLPSKPKIFLISVLSGNMKLGSSGEYVNKADISKIPEANTIIPIISEILFIVKLINKLAVFLIFILMNQLYHFVSSNFYC